jgi:Holliday junction resolvase RusA-like endonuclease
MTAILHLPFPPSVNAATRFGKGRAYSSPEKRAFFRDADALYLAQKKNVGFVKGRFTYHLILNDKMRHGNADGDNRGKYALDFAQHVGLIENDKLAQGGSWVWGPCEFGAMLSIHPYVASALPEALPETRNGGHLAKT